MTDNSHTTMTDAAYSKYEKCCAIIRCFIIFLLYLNIVYIIVCTIQIKYVSYRHIKKAIKDFRRFKHRLLFNNCKFNEKCLTTLIKKLVP